jgi:hypothetical protein
VAPPLACVLLGWTVIPPEGRPAQRVAPGRLTQGARGRHSARRPHTGLLPVRFPRFYTAGNTGEWSRQSITLPVPTGSARIAFGALLHGRGTIYLDSVVVERLSSEASEGEAKARFGFEP